MIEGHPLAETNIVPAAALHLLDNAPTSLCRDDLEAASDIFFNATEANSRVSLCGLESLIKEDIVTPHNLCASVFLKFLLLVSDQHNVLPRYIAENPLSCIGCLDVNNSE